MVLRTLFYFSMMVTVTVLLNGCTTLHKAPFSPPGGAIFSNIKAPLTTNYHDTPVSKKRGEATSLYLADPFFTGLSIAWDQCDIQTAAKNGHLEKIHYADYSAMQFLGVIGKTTITAYGD